MSVISRMLLVISVVAGCGSAQATPLLGNQERTFLIEGPIGDDSILEIGQELLKLSHKSTRLPVDLILNSPGGSVAVGFMFISQMEAAKQNGLVIRCIVSDIAASMAFGILVHCNERHVLSNSFLLWHRARIFAMGVTLTSPMGRHLMEQLGLLDAQILDEVLATMPDTNPAAVEYHFENETLHTGHSLSKLAPDFAEVHTAIPGLYLAMAKLRAKPGQQNKSRQNMLKPGHIIYIRPGLWK